MTKFYKFYLYFQYLCAALWVFAALPLLAVIVFFTYSPTGILFPLSFDQILPFVIRLIVYWILCLIPLALLYKGIIEQKKLAQGKTVSKRGKIIIIISPLFSIAVLFLITILLFGNIP